VTVAAQDVVIEQYYMCVRLLTGNNLQYINYVPVQCVYIIQGGVVNNGFLHLRLNIAPCKHAPQLTDLPLGVVFTV